MAGIQDWEGWQTGRSVVNNAATALKSGRQFVFRRLFPGAQGAPGASNGRLSPGGVLGRNAAAADCRLDHPRLNRRLLHQNTLLAAECPNGITRYLKRLMSIVRHVARLEGHLMDEVSIALRPIFKKINGVRQRDYLPNQTLPFL
jgi:hypothetical protein